MKLETTETYNGRPLVLELDIVRRNGRRVAQLVSVRPKGTRRLVPISLLGAWQAAQVHEARLPERVISMTPRRRAS